MERETALLRNDINGFEQEMTPFSNYVRHTLPSLENLVEYNRNADGHIKKKILGCIFSEKLVV